MNREVVFSTIRCVCYIPERDNRSIASFAIDTDIIAIGNDFVIVAETAQSDHKTNSKLTIDFFPVYN